MPTMNITLDLSDEQLDALDARVALFNEHASTPVTSAEFVHNIYCIGPIDQLVSEAKSNAANRILEAAASLSYAQRTSLIELNEAFIAENQ